MQHSPAGSGLRPPGPGCNQNVFGGNESAMQIGLILLFLAFPLLEVAVLIKVGQVLGFWWTVLLLVGTAVAGGLIAHAQGLSAARRAVQSMNEGRPPLEPVVDSFMLMIAGTLLMIPGLITDALALPLLVPSVRRAVARWALQRLFAGADIHVQTHEWRAGPQGDGPRPPAGGTVIDGEWQRVDEPARDGKPPDKRLPGGGDRGG